MRFSRVLILIVMCILLTSDSFAQTFKLDEFRQVDEIGLKTRVYSLFNHLNYNREARGHVIVYAAADGHISAGETLPLIDRIKQFVAGSPFHDELITVTYGGLRKTEAAEIYVVPKGAAPPGPTWTVGHSGGETDAVLWSTRRFLEEDGVLEDYVNRAVLYRLAEEENYDRDYTETTEYNGPAYIIENDSVPISIHYDDHAAPEPLEKSEPDRPSRWESDDPQSATELTAEDLEELRFDWIERDFAGVVAMRDGSHGVMIVYADDQFYDTSRLLPFIERGRDRITGLAGLDVDQIEVVFGGYRGRAQIEYYIVPEGGKAPDARPEGR